MIVGVLFVRSEADRDVVVVEHDGVDTSITRDEADRLVQAKGRPLQMHLHPGQADDLARRTHLVLTQRQRRRPFPSQLFGYPADQSHASAVTVTHRGTVSSIPLRVKNATSSRRFQ